MAGPGRLPIPDPDQARRIVADLAAGLTRACAAERNGVAPRTLRSWVARGQKGGRGNGKFMAFRAAVLKAERDAEALAIGSIRQIAKGGLLLERKSTTDKQGRTTVTEKFTQPDWRAWAWWCERKLIEAWGQNPEVLREIFDAYRKRKRKKPDA